LWGIVIIIDTVDKNYYTYEYDKVIFETSTKNPENLVWNVYGINLISRELNGETGLYYLNARFYDPETARFI